MTERFRSKSEHPKKQIRKYSGPTGKTADRNGQPTRVTNIDMDCSNCGAALPAGQGWLLILPFGAGDSGKKKKFAALCMGGC